VALILKNMHVLKAADESPPLFNWGLLEIYEELLREVALLKKTVYNVITCRIMSTSPQDTEHFGEVGRLYDR